MKLAQFLFLLPLAAAAADKADLPKLENPATREAEAARLTGCDGKERTLAKYRLHEAPQKEGGPLRVLAVESDYHFKFVPTFANDDYAIEKPDELFGMATQAPRELLVPALLPIRSGTLRIFDQAGTLLDPFGEDDWIRKGHLYDFNRDGILERADVIEESVSGLDWHQIDVFTLRTIERQPRTLLRVLFNWHSKLTNEPNGWQVSCFDENGDGIVEIGFGPARAASEREQRRFVFRWDAARQEYSAGEIPAGAHLRVLKPDEGLEEIAKADGLGYALKKDDEGTGRKPSPRPPAEPYVFRSLKDLDDTAMLAFFNGRGNLENMFGGPEDAVPNQAPPDFWKLTPKQAALALADVNRTPTHRYRWKLAVDDRGGIAPPESGWWVYDWDSSGCYTSSSHLYALRFGKKQSWLLVRGENSSGVVGANPLADQPGYTARMIPLAREEAEFLAHTLFWLDRVRSLAVVEAERDRAYGSSSADGHGSLYLIPEGRKPREIADTVVWATSTISASWGEDYHPRICLNLTEYLFDSMLPARLGERWNVAPGLVARGASTPLEERLIPRFDQSQRKQLAATLAGIFGRHAEDPVPALALTSLVRCVGDEALTELRPEMERVQASLAAKNAEDKEYEALAARFQFDHFGNAERDDPKDHPKDYARFQKLAEKRQFETGAMLRRPLAATLQKLDMAGNAKRLIKEADAGTDLSVWALNRLRHNFPEQWELHLIRRFREEDAEGRSNIFETLSAASPEGGKALVEMMSAKQVKELLLEVAAFEVEADPERAKTRVSDLLAIVKDRQHKYSRRGQAMRVLAAIALDEAQAGELRSLLLEELQNPQKDEQIGLSTVDDAVQALARLPGAIDRLDALQAANKGGIFGFSRGLQVLEQSTRGRPDREQRLEAYLKPCLEKHHGMMYEVFFAALAFDLKGLAPGIAAYATSGPDVVDGNGGFSSSGSFTGPAGERYHAAREVTALWSETDPATLARMWVAFAASHAFFIQPGRHRDEAVGQALREKAAAAIGKLSEEERKTCVAKAVAGLADATSRTRAETVLGVIAEIAKER